MSYDLRFRSRPGAAPLTREAFAGYFAGRRHVTAQGDQAWYENEDSEVYCSFQWSDGSEAEGEPAGASFNLNFYRPRVFGLEAEAEVGAFVRAFDLLVDDPQSDGMGEGEYAAEGFLRGWNRGNEFACQAIRQLQGPGQSLPGAELERIWRWNRGRAALQEALGDEIFVPRIMLLLHEGEAKPAIAWTSGMPVALPACELIALGGVMPAPGEPPQPFVLVSYAAARELLLLPALSSVDLPHHLLERDTPQAVLRQIAALGALAGPAELLPLDQVIDRELVAA